MIFSIVFRCANQSFDQERYLQIRKENLPYLCASLKTEKKVLFFMLLKPFLSTKFLLQRAFFKVVMVILESSKLELPKAGIIIFIFL